jgi:hypothetical protein
MAYHLLRDVEVEITLEIGRRRMRIADVLKLTPGQTLALYDGLDGVCGHPYAPTALGATRFSTLASLLAADAILIDTSKTVCAAYMSVEANALAGRASTDCGGRKVDYDVVDATMSVIVGSPAPDTVTSTYALAPTFPYFQ